MGVLHNYLPLTRDLLPTKKCTNYNLKQQIIGEYACNYRPIDHIDYYFERGLLLVN